MGPAQPTVVGRRSELGAIEAFLARASDGAAALAVIGPAGIGKTTVWTAGLGLAAEHGWRTLVAQPTGVEAAQARPDGELASTSTPNPRAARRACGICDHRCRR